MLMTFLPTAGWYKNKEQLAKRVAQIIGFTDCCPPWKSSAAHESDEKWTLNATNDWWLRFNSNGTCNLHFRYQYSEEQWAALKTVIELFLSER